MVLLRCAWHRKYWGYGWLFGIATWRGRRVTFSDGMCHRCAQRWRHEWRAARDEDGIFELIPSWVPRVGLVVALLAATLLSARPLNQPAGTAPDLVDAGHAGSTEEPRRPRDAHRVERLRVATAVATVRLPAGSEAGRSVRSPSAVRRGPAHRPRCQCRGSRRTAAPIEIALGSSGLPQAP